MPNGVRRNNNSRHSNRHRQQELDVVIAEVFDSRVIIQGENVDVDEIAELRRELQELKRSQLKEEKDNTKILKQSGDKLEEVFDRLKKEISVKDKLADTLCQYETIIQYFEEEGMIEFKNKTKGRRLSRERTLENLDIIYIHNKEGKEIPFRQIYLELQKLEDKNDKLKKLCEKLMKGSLPFGGVLKVDKDSNGEVDVSVNHDVSIKPDDNQLTKWSWKGVDYRIDVNNKQVFDMDGRQVGETIGKIPHIWDKWWEELD